VAVGDKNILGTVGIILKLRVGEIGSSFENVCGIIYAN